MSGYLPQQTIVDNGHVRPPDTTKHESMETRKHKNFHIPPWVTTQNEQ